MNLPHTNHLADFFLYGGVRLTPGKQHIAFSENFEPAIATTPQTPQQSLNRV